MASFENSDSLGGRLPLLQPADLSSDQQDLHSKLEDTMVTWATKSGFEAEISGQRLIGPFNPMLRSPAISQALLALIKAEEKNTTLSEKVRQVIILSVGAVWQAAYELYAHTAVAQKAGLDDATIQALVAGQTPATLTADEHVAHAFSRHLTAEYRVTDELYQQAVDTFGEQGVVDLIYLAGNYMTTCALLNAFAVPAPA